MVAGYKKRKGGFGMNSNYVRRTIGRTLLMWSLLFGIAVVTNTSVHAQYPLGPERQDIYRAAQDRGYQDGFSVGANDAQRGLNFDPQRSYYYRFRNAMDYDASYASTGAYRRGFREGFMRGYQEGYQRYNGNRRWRHRLWPW